MQSYNKSIEDFLTIICEQIRFKSIHNSIKNELIDHISCLKNEYIKKGIDDQNASLKALEQMGDPILIGKQLNQTHKPKVEWSILSLAFILVAIGGTIQLLLSRVAPSNSHAFSRFLIYAPLGIAAFAFLYFFDYMLLGRYAKLVYFSFLAAAILIFCI